MKYTNQECGTHRKMEEVDDGPRGTWCASKDREHEEPREEEDGDVGGPYTGVHEPLRILVQIHRRLRLHVQFPHYAPFVISNLVFDLEKYRGMLRSREGRRIYNWNFLKETKRERGENGAGLRVRLCCYSFNEFGQGI